MSYTITNGDGSTMTGAEAKAILNGVYGEIHVHDNAVAQAIPAGATYTKITAYDDDGLARGVTPDQANSKIVLDTAGIYKISSNMSFASGTQNVEFFGGAFLDGVEQDQIHFTRKVGTAADIGSASCHGFITATAGQELDFRVRHDNVGSIDITVSYANLNVILLELS